MKRKTVQIIGALLLVATLLCGCGSTASAPSSPPEEMTNDQITGEYGDAMAGGAPSTAPKSEEQPAKRIYTATLEMETTGFDAASQGLNDLVKTCGGWFESSSVSNRENGYRYANYTIRVPAKQFDAFCAKVGDLCHLLNRYSNTQDVSEYYYDTAGRLKTQQTKLARLQALLAQAETMEDLITVESAISETEAAIEALSGELQHYDALVDYSTVTIDLSEVYQLSNVEPAATGFWSRMGVALSSGWKGFVTGMETLAVALAYSWMWLTALALVIFAVVRILRRRKKDVAKPPKLPQIHLKKEPIAADKTTENSENKEA